MSQSFARMSAVTVDSVAGSDYNAGSSLAPLKTWGELRRRIGPSYGLFKQATTITVPNPLPSGDPMLVDFGVDTNAAGTASGLTITGPYASVGATGTVATARNRDHATKTYNGITSSTGGFDWSPYAVSDRILIGTGGSINGLRAWVVSNDGSALATLSTVFNSSTFGEATIANADTYAFQQLMRVDSASFRCPRGAVKCQGFVFTNAPLFAKPSGGALTMQECSFETFISLIGNSSGTSFLNCRFQVNATSGSISDAQSTILAGLFINIGSHAGGGGGLLCLGAAHVTLGSGFFLQNTSISVDHGGYVRFSDVMFRGGTVDYSGIRMQQHGRATVNKISGTIDSATPYGVISDNSSHFLFISGGGIGTQTVLNLSGANGDVLMFSDGTLLTWEQIRDSAFHINGTDSYMAGHV